MLINTAMWTRLVASSLLVLCIVPLVAAKPAGFAADITLIWVEADGEVSDTVKLATDKVYGGDLALDHTQELQVRNRPLSHQLIILMMFVCKSISILCCKKCHSADQV